ncbi:MAG: FkbM family methyltransferase [Solirubrobacteraceae bacterium]
MISYSQNREDVVLARAFPDGTGFYVDVGAASPSVNSVTRHFYERGWCGVNIDPLPQWHDALVRERPRDVNLGVGVAGRSGSLLFYDVASEAAEESTFSSDVARLLRARGLNPSERSVPVTTLRHIWEEHVREPVDFLKVDVEGLELDVLRGAQWETFRPRLVLLESIQPVTWDSTGGPLEEFMAKVGYERALFDGINHFFVERGDETLLRRLAAPANATDDYEDAQLVRLRCELERERDLGAATILRLQERLRMSERDLLLARRDAADSAIEGRAAIGALTELIDARD